MTFTVLVLQILVGAIAADIIGRVVQGGLPGVLIGYLLTLGSLVAWLWWPNRRSTLRNAKTIASTPAVK